MKIVNLYQAWEQRQFERFCEEQERCFDMPYISRYRNVFGIRNTH